MKILVYPFEENPYQELLYSQIKLKGHKIIYLNKIYRGKLLSKFFLPLFPLYLIYYRIIGYSIFHLHWQSFNLCNNREKNWVYRISFIISNFYIKLIKLLGFKLVWTIHNLVPHEKITSNDLGITRLLCNIADAKIVHSNETLLDMKKLKLNTNNTFIIPHGSYVGVYPNLKKDTKKKFGFLKDDFVFLSLGNIREYKGIPELLKAFSQINNKKVKLLVAGNCGDNESKELLDRYSKKDKRIIFKEGFVKDEEIQDYMNASDIIVYPFRRITTSGSVILASSFGKPTIYPSIGGLRELPNNIGFSYNPKEKNGLINSMKKAIISDNLNKLGENGYKYAKSLSWKNIAKKTIKVYEIVTKK